MKKYLAWGDRIKGNKLSPPVSYRECWLRLVFWRCWVRISAGTPNIPRFSTMFSPNFPGNCNDCSCLRPLPFSSRRFSVNPSSYSSTLYSLAAEIVDKRTTKWHLSDGINRKSLIVDIVLKLSASLLSSPYNNTEYQTAVAREQLCKYSRCYATDS
jgi:hypothetical protein